MWSFHRISNENCMPSACAHFFNDLKLVLVYESPYSFCYRFFGMHRQFSLIRYTILNVFSAYNAVVFFSSACRWLIFFEIEIKSNFQVEHFIEFIGFRQLLFSIFKFTGVCDRRKLFGNFSVVYQNIRFSCSFCLFIYIENWKITAEIVSI